MKIIVVEGCDGTGKSTYVHDKKCELRKNLKVHSVHIDGKFPNTLQSYIEMIESYEALGTDILIFDRSWIGEFVWSKKFRNGVSRISEKEVEMLNSIYDISYILIENTPEKILNVFKNRGEDALEHDENTIKNIQNDFLDTFEKLKIVPERLVLF